MKQERGKEIVRRMAQASDVLVEKFRPGHGPAGPAEYGAERRRPCWIRPRLVTGFGETGPTRSAGVPLTAQAMSLT